jgi:hypothetical protein
VGKWLKHNILNLIAAIFAGIQVWQNAHREQPVLTSTSWNVPWGWIIVGVLLLASALINTFGFKFHGRSLKIKTLATPLTYVDQKPPIGYPLKMHVEMRNDCSECIEVRLSGYRPGLATVKRVPLDVLQIKYSGTWTPEEKPEEHLAVLPSQQFRAWIGLDENKFTKEQLEQALGKIGTLVLAVNGRTFDIPV